jgi:hypothetical protein
MKRIAAIVGFRITCNRCGGACQLVMVPAIGDRWQVCEPVGETEVIRLHPCPKHPDHIEE